MTYAQYKKETIENCKKALADVAYNDLSDLELLKKLLWEDDRVTGAMSGCCSSMAKDFGDSIGDILFDSEFLKDFNSTGLNMQKVMSQGANAIDIVARCLALSHVNVKELARIEILHRGERETHLKSAMRV